MGVVFTGELLSRYSTKDGFTYMLNSDGRAYRKVWADYLEFIPSDEFINIFEYSLNYDLLEEPKDIIVDIDSLVDLELVHFTYYNCAPLPDNVEDIEAKRYRFLKYLMQKYPYLSSIRVLYLLTKLDKEFNKNLKGK